MLSVRKEWLEAETDTDRLAWANKWGDLLMEDFQNPIWTAGYAQCRKEFIALLEKIRKNEEEIDMEDLEEEVQAYVRAIDIVSQKLKYVSFNIDAGPEVLHNLDEETLKEIAAEQMAKVLIRHITIDTEDLPGDNIRFHFNLTMVDD